MNVDTMKEVTLKIPENRLTFFLELVEQLGFEVAGELEIPEEHKAIVRDRIKNSTKIRRGYWIGNRFRIIFS